MPKLASRLIDYIYPASCHHCQEPLTYGATLCTTCIEDLTPVDTPFCSTCGECFDGNIDGEFTCPNCHGLDMSFSFARAAYQECTTLREMIHDFKYGRQIHLARELANLTSEAIKADTRYQSILENSLLIPVPLHWRRQRKRRFNQAEEITRHLAKSLGIPWANALKRTRNTQTQTRFSRKKRLKNLHSAFVVRRRHFNTLKNRPVILVDDVFTTGSTANECARTLAHHGASEVAVLTVMRG